MGSPTKRWRTPFTTARPCEGSRALNLSAQGVPDATTLLKFRPLLEAHELTKSLFEEVNALLEESQRLMREGTLIDATLLSAPSSTKNKAGERAPARHSTKKGHKKT